MSYQDEKLTCDPILTEQIQPRDIERFVDISGSDFNGLSKAQVRLRYFHKFSDGREFDFYEKTVKPIVHIFKHAGFVNVFLDFGTQTNSELHEIWNVLSLYSNETQRISYLPEELESGVFETVDGMQDVFFPSLELMLIPSDEKEKYLITGYNPIFFPLGVESPFHNPCILQLVFLEETFGIHREEDTTNYSLIHYLTMEQIRSIQQDIGSALTDISGTTLERRTKARLLFRYYHKYSDGTSQDIQIMTIEKPVVNIISEQGFVNVYLDFGSKNDMDLRMMWDILSEYKKPKNGIHYTPEEMEAGVYQTDDGEKLVYFPVLELALSPIGKEDSYMILGYNPAFFTLVPNQFSSDLCVLHFCFCEETFAVVNDLDKIDESAIQTEVLRELELEMEANGR